MQLAQCFSLRCSCSRPLWNGYQTKVKGWLHTERDKITYEDKGLTLRRASSRRASRLVAPQFLSVPTEKSRDESIWKFSSGAMSLSRAFSAFGVDIQRQNLARLLLDLSRKRWSSCRVRCEHSRGLRHCSEHSAGLLFQIQSNVDAMTLFIQKKATQGAWQQAVIKIHINSHPHQHPSKQ